MSKSKRIKEQFRTGSGMLCTESPSPLPKSLEENHFPGGESLPKKERKNAGKKSANSRKSRS